MGETHENLRNTIIIPKGARERFLDLDAMAAKPLNDLKVFQAGVSDLCAGYEIRRHRIFHHLMLYTLAGSGVITYPTPTVLQAHDLLIAPAWLTYSYRWRRDTWRIVWFHLDASAPLHAYGSGNMTVRPSYLLPQLYHATEGYLAESLRETHAARRAANLHADLIAHYIQSELELTEEPHTRQMQTRFYQLWDSVNADLPADWSVARLAALMYVSTGHFHRLCLEYTGLSPMQMVTRLRMQRAKELLKHDYPLKLISQMVGYQNPFAFSTAFKRAFGQPPRAFRRLL